MNIYKLWEDYAEKYNALSKEMLKMEIDIKLLTSVLNALTKLINTI